MGLHSAIKQPCPRVKCMRAGLFSSGEAKNPVAALAVGFSLFTRKTYQVMCSSTKSSFTRKPICLASAMGKVRMPVLSYFGVRLADGSRRWFGPVIGSFFFFFRFAISLDPSGYSFPPEGGAYTKCSRFSVVLLDGPVRLR